MILEDYTIVLEATMGAILANQVVASKESSKTIRDLSKQLDNLSVALRKELIELDKTLVINNDSN